MPNSFFKNFPIIKYNGANCVNITERVAFIQSVFMNSYLYYPFDLEGDERADQLANRYYGDSYESWIFYLSNQIYDPLREWYLPVDVFTRLVMEKYGSLQSAIQKTKFYRNNWMNGEDITVSRYDSLTPLLQGYYEPKTVGYRITSYKRRPIDWTINTNRIVAYNVSNTSFIEDELVNIVFNKDNTGQGQVLSVDTASNTVFLQHVTGVYIETSSYLQTENQDYILGDNDDFFNEEYLMIGGDYITINGDYVLSNTLTTENPIYIMVDGDSYLFGTESSTNTTFNIYANGTFIPSCVVAENLDPTEDVFWTPVSYYDYETEKNEYNKSIRVLDARYAPTAVNNLRELLTQ